MKNSVNTPVNETMNRVVAVEDSADSRCYMYFLVVSGHLWRLCAHEWWATPEQMKHEACGMCAAAQIFRHSAAVAVYELRDDNYFHYAFGCSLPVMRTVPESFPHYDVPVIRRQSVR